MASAKQAVEAIVKDYKTMPKATRDIVVSYEHVMGQRRFKSVSRNAVVKQLLRRQVEEA